MMVGSIAIRVPSVATLWRAIDWRSRGVFVIGGFLGVPVGVYLLLHLPTTTYRSVIGSMLVIYGSYLLLRPPVRSLRLGQVSDVCAGFLGGITGGLPRVPLASVPPSARLSGGGQGRRRRRDQPLCV